MDSRFERHIQITADGSKAVDLLCAESGLNRTQIKQIMQKGAVWCTRENHTQRLRRATRLLRAGDELHLYYDAKVLEQHPVPAELFADEGDYSVWIKPYGMLSQGSKWGDHCVITRWVELHLQPQRPAYLVHRLDRAASGLILIAHTKRVANDLAALFRERVVEKVYRVLVQGEFPNKPRPIVMEEALDGKTARSLVSRLDFDPENNQSLLHVSIETGRKHQIRRHLSDAGFPVVGDRLYGGGDETQDLQLSANFLSFDCPLTHWKRRFAVPEDSLPRLLRSIDS